MRQLGQSQPAMLHIGQESIGTCDKVILDQGPAAPQGKELLAHELTHVVQQKAGQPVTLRLAGLDPKAAARIVPSQVRIVVLSMADATGRKFGISGRVKHLQQRHGSTSGEWEIVFESIQRAL